MHGNSCQLRCRYSCQFKGRYISDVVSAVKHCTTVEVCGVIDSYDIVEAVSGLFCDVKINMNRPWRLIDR